MFDCIRNFINNKPLLSKWVNEITKESEANEADNEEENGEEEIEENDLNAHREDPYKEVPKQLSEKENEIDVSKSRKATPRKPAPAVGSKRPLEYTKEVRDLNPALTKRPACENLKDLYFTMLKSRA